MNGKLIKLGGAGVLLSAALLNTGCIQSPVVCSGSDIDCRIDVVINECVAQGNGSTAYCGDVIRQCVDAGSTPEECEVTLPLPKYLIGGNVTGLSGSVELTDIVSGQTKIVSTTGAYRLDDKIEKDASYDVQVLSQPSGETCSVVNPTGTVSTSEVSNINVDCVTPPVTPFLRYAFEEAYDAGDPSVGIRDTGLWGSMHPTMDTVALVTVDANDFVTGSTPGSHALKMDAPLYTGTNHDYVKVRSNDGHTQILNLKANGLTVRSKFKLTSLGEWTSGLISPQDDALIEQQNETSSMIISIGGGGADTEVIVNIYANVGGRLDRILVPTRGTSFGAQPGNLDPNSIGIEIGDGTGFKAIATNNLKINNHNWNDLYVSMNENTITVTLNGSTESYNISGSGIVPNNYISNPTSQIYVGVKKNVLGNYHRNFRGFMDSICVWDSVVDISSAFCE